MTQTARAIPATSKDLDILLPLVRHYHQFEAISISESERLAAVKTLLENDQFGRVWLIVSGDDIVGYIAICFGFTIEFGGRDAFVDEFFILESHRGRGIGKHIAQIICDQIRASGVKAVHLEVARDNQPARSLYKKVGFVSRENFHLMSLVL